MKVAVVLSVLFAAMAIAAPSETVKKVTKVKRYYGEQFCDCITDCENECAGSGCEGGVGLAACENGCYEYPTPTASTCSEY